MPKRSLEASEQGEQGDDCDSDDCEQGDDCDSDGVYANKATIATATENYTVYTYHEDHYSDYYDQDDYYYHPDHFGFKVKSLPKLTCRKLSHRNPFWTTTSTTNGFRSVMMPKMSAQDGNTRTYSSTSTVIFASGVVHPCQARVTSRIGMCSMGHKRV